MAKLYTIAATVLYQHGLTWDHAEAYARSSFKAAMAAIPLEELIRPVGDVKLLLSDLRAAKAQIAIITTDDRSETEETMAVLDIEDQIDFLACGDDSVPLKPAPDAILNACDHLGVEPIRTLVVGDTVTDMMMAKNAGVGCRAAVLTGAGSRDALVEHANVVLDSIAQIHVSCS